MIDVEAFNKICPHVDIEFVEIVNETALLSGIDPEILAAVIAVESNCKHNARSYSGAVGYTQIMPGVWNKKAKSLKLNIYDPEDNIFMGAKILSIYSQNRSNHSALKRYHGYTKSEVSEATASAYAQKVLKHASKITSRTWDKENKKCICTPEICSTSSTGITITSVLLPLIMLFIMVSWLWAADMRVIPLLNGLKRPQFWVRKFKT